MDESDEEEDGRRLTMSPPPLPSIPGSAVPPPLPPQLGEVQIRKNYDPKGEFCSFFYLGKSRSQDLYLKEIS